MNGTTKNWRMAVVSEIICQEEEEMIEYEKIVAMAATHYTTYDLSICQQSNESISTVTGDLKVFDRFPDLPYDLRKIIWEFCAYIPQIHAAHMKHGVLVPLGKASPLREVCEESRAAAMKIQKPVTNYLNMSICPPNIFANLEIDTLWLPECLTIDGREQLSQSLEEVTYQLETAVMRQGSTIKRVAVPVDFCNDFGLTEDLADSTDIDMHFMDIDMFQTQWLCAFLMRIDDFQSFSLVVGDPGGNTRDMYLRKATESPLVQFLRFQPERTRGLTHQNSAPKPDLIEQWLQVDIKNAQAYSAANRENENANQENIDFNYPEISEFDPSAVKVMEFASY